MSTAHLHARYAGLLLAPAHLSADWSHACVPLVASPRDPRNALAAALYCCLLYVCLAARPWSIPIRWLALAWRCCRPPGRDAPYDDATPAPAPAPAQGRSGSGGSSSDERHLGVARWRLSVLVGLTVAPFFPASNVLFYVGTFIGE